MKYENIDINVEEVQKEQVNILLELDRVCKKHNINYQLMAGTLLGAVRHKGFIPWDDDIDVCMLREDYERFLESSKELKSDFFVQNCRTDKEFILQYTKIRKNGSLFLEKSLAEFDIHHGIYIDVFPLDNIKVNKITGTLQQKILYALGRINLTRSKDLCLNNNSNFVVKILSVINHHFIKLIPNKIINISQTKVACIFNTEDTEYVSHLTNGASKKRLLKYKIKKEDFYNTVNLEFEGYLFPSPVNYEENLNQLFGDFMELPPIEEQKPHHGAIQIQIKSKK